MFDVSPVASSVSNNVWTVSSTDISVRSCVRARRLHGRERNRPGLDVWRLVALVGLRDRRIRDVGRHTRVLVQGVGSEGRVRSGGRDLQEPWRRILVLGCLDEAHRVVADVRGRVLGDGLDRAALVHAKRRITGREDGPVIERGWGPEHVPCVEVLPEHAGPVADRLQIGLDREPLIEHARRVVRAHAVVVHVAAREDGRARRTACRRRGKGVVESGAAGLEPLERLRHHGHRAVQTLIVGQDHEDVRPPVGRSRRGAEGSHQHSHDKRGQCRTKLPPPEPRYAESMARSSTPRTSPPVHLPERGYHSGLAPGVGYRCHGSGRGRHISRAGAIHPNRVVAVGGVEERCGAGGFA